MEYTEIKGVPIRASRIGLGTWAIGGDLWGGADDDASIATIHRALELGITLLDTAPGYGNGHSEEVVGRALVGRRDKVIIATKFGLEPVAGGGVVRNSSTQEIQRELEDSLRRLQTDYIDLYQVHWPDANTPFEETAATLKGLLDAGKIRAIGVSNFSVAQIERFSRLAPLRTVQPPLNMFERGAEAEILPYAHTHGLTALTYGALCRGLLSGRMDENTHFANDDLRGAFDPKFKQPLFGQYVRAVQALDKYAQTRYRKRVIHLALRWVLDRPGVGVALWGARRPTQLDPLPEVFDFHLDGDAFAEIDRIIAREVAQPLDPVFMGPPERETERR
ncbi:MAG: aldo/keto reductase [Candidatus Eremiobacteraeota bacterium]|nr:aldo/keto reductase [Candidatus Eremiobacteraeota bacterium]MBV8366317.1 aldo/keto reductase [Candidatus Eremiobacteraeota bacterium]